MFNMLDSVWFASVTTCGWTGYRGRATKSKVMIDGCLVQGLWPASSDCTSSRPASVSLLQLEHMTIEHFDWLKIESKFKIPVLSDRVQIYWVYNSNFSNGNFLCLYSSWLTESKLRSRWQSEKNLLQWFRPYNSKSSNSLPFSGIVKDREKEGALKMRDWKMRDWNYREQETYGTPRLA